METVQKRLEAELTQLQQQTRREREETAATHDAEVRDRCLKDFDEVAVSSQPCS